MDKIRTLFSKSSLHSFQILSDLHLEVGQQYSTFAIPPSAPYLILAGDIGRLTDYDSYLSFLVRQTQSFKNVLLVLGNHEFYGLSIAAGLEQAYKLEKEPVLKGKLVLLQQGRFDVPNTSLSILGCTLWSSIPNEARQVVQARGKDFERITRWSVADHNAAHEADALWLKAQMMDVRDGYEDVHKKQSRRKVIIVTHHAPSMQGTSSPQHVDNPWSSAFATDLLDGEGWCHVKLWIFGHTHFTTEFRKEGIRIMSNQRGYVLPGSDEGKMRMEKDKKRSFDVSKVFRM